MIDKSGHLSVYTTDVAGTVPLWGDVFKAPG
jgi:hypothetical protein